MQAFCGLFSFLPFSYYIIFLPVFLVFQWVLGCGVKPNYAYVKLFFLVAEVSHIADPDFIRARCGKLLVEIILAPFGLLIILFLRALTDTAQPHILH